MWISGSECCAYRDLQHIWRSSHGNNVNIKLCFFVEMLYLASQSEGAHELFMQRCDCIKNKPIYVPDFHVRFCIISNFTLIFISFLPLVCLPLVLEICTITKLNQKMKSWLPTWQIVGKFLLAVTWKTCERRRGRATWHKQIHEMKSCFLCVHLPLFKRCASNKKMRRLCAWVEDGHRHLIFF